MTVTPSIALADQATNDASDSEVIPKLEPGNPTCQDIGYLYGVKYNTTGSEGESNLSEKYFDVGPGKINWTWAWPAADLDWNSNFGISAVIVKGSNSAYAYVYNSKDFEDSGLTTPINNGNQRSGLSHVEFCFNGVVVKTVETHWTRKCTWSLEKTAGDPVYGENGALIDYTVTADASPTDTYVVKGNITVYNPGTAPIKNVVVTDEISNFGPVAVSCGSSGPIAGNTSLVCSYGPVEVNAAANLNTATARGLTANKQAIEVVYEGVGTAPIHFSKNPDVEVGASATLEDVLLCYGNLECTPSANHSAESVINAPGAEIKYTVTVSGCGTDEVKNTAVLTPVGGQSPIVKSVIKTVALKTCDEPQPTKTETAFAKGDANTCFLDIKELKASRWGWTNGPLGYGTYVFELWAGAGQCDTAKGTLVGTVTVVYNNDGTASVTYQTTGQYTLAETHLYIGAANLPTQKQGKNNVPTVAPGQYPYQQPSSATSQTVVYNVSGLSGNIYVIAHAVVDGFPISTAEGQGIFDTNQAAPQIFIPVAMQ